MLNTVLAILTDDMRERKALVMTVDEHGLSLIVQVESESFRFHFPE